MALGKKISDLLAFVKPKHNVHGEIKRMASSMWTLFDQIADMEMPLLADTPETSIAGTQTTPGRSTDGERAAPTTAAAVTQTTPGLRPQRSEDASKKRKPLESPEIKEKKRRKADRKRNGPPDGALPPLSAPASTTRPTEMDWQVATKRKSKLSKSRSSRPDIVIVKAKDGGPTYSEILRQLKTDPSLKEVGDSVAKVRRNAAGDLLLQLGKSVAATQVSGAISRTLGDSASIVTRTDEMTFEIRDLDELTSTADICDALGKSLESTIEVAAVKSIRKAYKGTQTAVVQLPMDLARKAVEYGKVRIGWVNCRIREKVEPKKCFRCWAFGHLARDCKGTDRSKRCRRCGEAGHVRADCKSKEAECVLCTNNNKHPTGSFACPVYQAAAKATAGRK